MHFDVLDKVSTLLHKKLSIVLKEAVSLKVLRGVCRFIICSFFMFLPPQCNDGRSAASAALWGLAVREPETTTMSADTASRPELEAEHHAELADRVETMTVAPSRMTPTNGFRSGPPRTTGSCRSSGRKMSLQERGRIARQPTIETKRVSITDADVSRPKLQKWYSELELHVAVILFFYFFIYFFAGLCPAQSVQDEERNWEGKCTYSCSRRGAEFLKQSFLPAGFIWSGETGL